MKKQLTFLFVTLFCFSLSSLNITAQTFRGDLSWAGAWQFGTSGAVHLDAERDLAFLASGGAVQIFDVSDPANPAVINQGIRTGGLVEDIWYNTDDGNLYLACGRGGFEVWDVNDQTNPQRLSQMPILYFDEETPVDHVEVYGNFAVLECGWGYIHTWTSPIPQRRSRSLLTDRWAIPHMISTSISSGTSILQEHSFTYALS